MDLTVSQKKQPGLYEGAGMQKIPVRGLLKTCIQAHLFQRDGPTSHASQCPYLVDVASQTALLACRRTEGIETVGDVNWGTLGGIFTL